MIRMYDSARRAEFILIRKGSRGEDRSDFVNPADDAVIWGLQSSASFATRLLLPCETVHPFVCR